MISFALLVLNQTTGTEFLPDKPFLAAYCPLSFAIYRRSHILSALSNQTLSTLKSLEIKTPWPHQHPLAIATSSVNRLLKEEASYHKEVEQEEAPIKALKEKIESGQGDEDGNGTYMLKQQQTALEQTKAVFEPLRKKIVAAVQKLEEQITVSEQTGGQEEQVQLAKETLERAKAAQNGA
ncbi:Tubulin-specific chaperone A [Fusarium sp. Ph1]|nr:Tubulin-specific chaperone A [Fusarium sp. Ph1]